jgi:4-hydroxybenzoate polyprenyltransferase
MILLMIIYYYEPLGWAVTLLFIFYFIRIYISNAACDVKDVKSDKRRGLKTLFVTFGVKNSTRILNLINVSSGLLIIYGVLMGIIPNYSLGILLTIPYAFFYFSLYQKVNNEVLANLVVDGEFLLWLPFLMIGKALS